MFRPSGDSRPVPLQKENWGWTGKFTQQAGNPPWVMDQGFSTQYASGMRDASDFPVWSQVISKDNFQWLP
jgi:hypothetical protein